MNDLALALRFFRRAPGLAAAALVSLALGIGVSSAVFSVVESLLLSPLPFAAPNELIYCNELAGPDRIYGAVSGPDLADWKTRQHSFSQLAGFRRTQLTLTGAGPAERIDAAAVESALFTALRVKPIRGRAFGPSDDATGAARVAVVSERFVRSHGEQATLTLEGQPFTVVGVMPASFRFPLDGASPDVWIQPQYAPFGELLKVRALFFYDVLGRLAPGVSLEQARAEISTITSTIVAGNPDSHANRTALVVPLREQLAGKDRGTLLLLFGAVALLLLVGCANVGSLLLARAVARRHDLAVRAALGATRKQLLRQLIVETLVLGLAGGALGVLVCALSLDAVSAMLPAELPRLTTLRVDLPVVGFAFLVSLISCVVFGTGPALLLSSASAQESLRGGQHGAPRALKLRSALVVGEVAIALALLVDATLLARSLRSAQQINPGFVATNLQAIDLTLPASHYPPDAQLRFADELLRRVQAIPGVTAAAFTSPLPMGGRGIGLTVGPRDRDEPHPPQSTLSSLTPGALSLFGIPLEQGREFAKTDTADSPPVVIVNRALAHLLWPGESALGKHIQLGPGDTANWEIVGVVRDIHNALDTPAGAQIYAPYTQVPWPFGSLVMRSALTPAALREELRREIGAIDSALPIPVPRALEAVLQGTLARRRFSTTVLTLFAGAALLLALGGVYGALSYLVAQRKRELAIRTALGAAPEQMLAHVLKQGLALGIIGVIIGAALALASSRALAAQVFGISATDPASYVATALAMIAASVLATLWPAWRATRTDPAQALRTE